MAATKKRPAKKGAKKAPAKKGSRSRATNEELDKQAAEVVKLRDQQKKSWGEVAEATGIAMSRLRQLYNRGGGKPTRERRGAAKKEAAKKSGSSKKGGAKKRPAKKRPS